MATHCQSSGSSLAASRPRKRPKKKVPTVDVALALILNPQGRILIQQRSNEGMLGGLWEFPGGKVEPGESTLAACRRELQEELGWTVDPIDLGLMVPHAYTHLKVRLHVFEVRVPSEQGAPSTPLNWRWVDKNELDSFAFPRGNRRIIDLLLQKRHVFSP
ncbi:MAG: (deoxy)nucleoside triphosphate pyrophosphohydrolase [Bacteroidetes bacterium]|nr:(deoxy)nucleoside triphosphate pyrophosphohydrolase [Bacteroidota bacterium]